MHVIAFERKFCVPELSRLGGDDHIGMNGGGVGIDIGSTAALNRKLDFKHGGLSVFADGNVHSVEVVMG